MARCARWRHAYRKGLGRTGVHDEQAADRVRRGVQGRAHGRQIAERLPLLLDLEEHLEDHAPATGMPGTADGAVRQRGLDQNRVVLLLPPESRELTVQKIEW